jgi:hypothetical protein
MPAGVLERRDGAVGAAVQNDVVTADRPAGERMLDFMAPRRWVPRIQGEGPAARHRFPPDLMSSRSSADEICACRIRSASCHELSAIGSDRDSAVRFF